ncbi:uncharacterized protein BO72DRAFT_499868, partial [Aspergillus fijiensis CBS 313.89]
LTDPNTRTTLFHANPIIQYLVDHYEHTNTLSTTATTTEKHLLNQWLHLQTTLSSSPSPNSQTHNVLATLNTALTNQPWLVGERCSHADLAFLPGLHGLASSSGDDGLGLELMRAYPFVAAWVGRMERRGAWGRVLAAREEVLRDVTANAVRPEEEGLLDGESEWEELEGCSVAVDRVEEDEGGLSVQPVVVEAVVRTDQVHDDEEEREGMMPCAAGFALQRVSTARQVLGYEHRDDDNDDDDDEREGLLPCAAFMLHAHAHAIPSQTRSGEDEDREGIPPCGAFVAHAKHPSNVTTVVEEDSDDDEREGFLPCGAFGAHAQYAPSTTAAEVDGADDDDDEREGMLPCTLIGLHSAQLPPKTTVVESESDSDDEKEGVLPCGAFGAHAQHAPSTTTPEVEVEDDDDEREGILPCGAFSAHAQHAPSTVEAEINNDNDADEKEGMLPCAGIGMPTPHATCTAEEDDFEREGMPPCSLMGMVY